MSENGPREGTRDLPRRHPETGHRAVERDSAAGLAYTKLSKSLRRRRSELVALLHAGATFATLAHAYEVDHPLEPSVSPQEIETAIGEVRGRSPRRPERP